MNNNIDEVKIGCVLFVLLLVFGLIYSAVEMNHRSTYTFTMSGKDHQCDGSGDSLDCYYVVFGTQGEVFSNRDSMWFGKWDSASVQARFLPGHRYRVETTGWRVPMLSMKPNIVTATEVK